MRSTLGDRPGLAVMLTALAVTSGCSYVRSSRRLDMQPFAENTVTAMGEMRKIETPPVWIRLRPYLSHPSVVAAREAGQPLRKLVRAVNAYSLQVVSLNEARISEPTKVRELVRFLRGASQVALLEEADEAEIVLTPARREEILKEIGEKETFMEALQAADPVVNAVLSRGLELSEALDASITQAANAIEAEIQTQYRAMLANRSALIVLQERSVRALAWAEAIRLGDDGSVDELRKSAPGLAMYLPAGRRPAAAEQRALVDDLAGQTLRIKTALDQIDPEYQSYRESVGELDRLRGAATENAKLARSVLMLWARSHKNLARGIEVPPAFDLAKVITGATGSAGKLLPF